MVPKMFEKLGYIFLVYFTCINKSAFQKYILRMLDVRSSFLPPPVAPYTVGHDRPPYKELPEGELVCDFLCRRCRTSKTFCGLGVSTHVIFIVPHKGEPFAPLSDAYVFFHITIFLKCNIKVYFFVIFHQPLKLIADELFVDEEGFLLTVLCLAIPSHSPICLFCDKCKFFNCFGGFFV